MAQYTVDKVGATIGSIKSVDIGVCDQVMDTACLNYSTEVEFNDGLLLKNKFGCLVDVDDHLRLGASYIYGKGISFIGTYTKNNYEATSQLDLLSKPELSLQVKKNISSGYAEGLDVCLNMKPEIGRFTEIGSTVKIILGHSIGYQGLVFKIGASLGYFRFMLPFKFYDFASHKASKLEGAILIGIHALVSLIAYLFKSNSTPRKSRNMEELIHSINAHHSDTEALSKLSLARRAYEENIKGIVILSAFFGKKSILAYIKEHHGEIDQYKESVKTKYDMQIIDVTCAVQFYVNKSQLILEGRYKRDTIGFCNPVIDGTLPWLLIM